MGELPAAPAEVRPHQLEPERPLSNRPLDQGQWFVQRVPEADVDVPLPARVLVGRQARDGEHQMVAQVGRGRTVGAVDDAAVPADPVAEALQQGRQRPVDLVAVAAAALEGDPGRRRVRVDAPAFPGLDPERLVRDPLGMSAVQPAQRLGGRRLGAQAQPAEIGRLDVDRQRTHPRSMPPAAGSLACRDELLVGDSQGAFAAAADWFVQAATQVGGRWERPGLGEWDVRALVGHTSRSLLTVESYLASPAESLAIPSTVAYYRATHELAAGPGVAERGRAAGSALGDDPAAVVAEIAARVVAVVEACDGTELVTTIVGGMRLADYLPTRTFELAVHTSDLARALGLPLDVPDAAAAQALRLVADLAVTGGLAGPLLLAATGRPVPEGRLSVL